MFKTRADPAFVFEIVVFGFCCLFRISNFDIRAFRFIRIVYRSASTPGNVLPSIRVKKAPPPVDI